MIAVEMKDFVKEYLTALSGAQKTPALIDNYVNDPELKEHIISFEAAFPKYEIYPDAFICEGDKVVVQARARGKHMGDLMGLAPTGNTIEIPFVVIYEIADEMIVKSWLTFDRMELLGQLGLIPSKN